MKDVPKHEIALTAHGVCRSHRIYLLYSHNERCVVVSRLTWHL